MFSFGKKKKEQIMEKQDEKDNNKPKDGIAEQGAERPEQDQGVEGVDESKATENENSQEASDMSDESSKAEDTEAEEASGESPDESENFKEVIEAQSAKISSLESELEALKVKFGELMSKDEGRDFGGQVTVPEGNLAEDKRNAVFESYAGAKAKNYY